MAGKARRKGTRVVVSNIHVGVARIYGENYIAKVISYEDTPKTKSEMSGRIYTLEVLYDSKYQGRKFKAPASVLRTYKG